MSIREKLTRLFGPRQRPAPIPAPPPPPALEPPPAPPARKTPSDRFKRAERVKQILEQTATIARLHNALDEAGQAKRDLDQDLKVLRGQLSVAVTRLREYENAREALVQDLNQCRAQASRRQETVTFYNKVDSLACAAIGKDGEGVQKAYEQMQGFIKSCGLVDENRAHYWNDAIARVRILRRQVEAAESFVGTWISDPPELPPLDMQTGLPRSGP